MVGTTGDWEMEWSRFMQKKEKPELREFYVRKEEGINIWIHVVFMRESREEIKKGVFMQIWKVEINIWKFQSRV